MPKTNYFTFDWSTHRLFVLNRCCKPDSLQIMILVNICSTFSVVELKTLFETWKASNEVSSVSLFHFSYLITLIAYLCSQIKYFMFDCLIYRLFVVNTAWKHDSIQMMIFVNVCSTWNMVELKTRFETWITRNDVNGVSMFHLPYLITLMAYLCSQSTANVQIKYFMFDW
jgi:hypothetical protein